MRRTAYSVALVSLFILVSFHRFTPSSQSQGSYNSVSLNGTTAYLDAPHSTSLNISGSVTIEAWIKLNNTAGSIRTVLQKAEWYGTEGGYELSINGEGKLRLDTYNTPTQYNGLVGNTALSANVWHHVAGVNDGTQQRVYVDGVLDGTAAATVPLSSSSRSLLIGRISYPYDIRWFNGLIDEVRVSSGAVYSSNFTPSAHLSATASTRALWKFDGSTTNDSSTNGNNATLHDAAAYSTDVPTGPNSSPSVNVTDPLNNTYFTSGSNIVIDAAATDIDGSVSKVEFFQGTTLLGQDTTAPYTFVWNNVPAASYALTAKATDDLNATTISSAITVTVIAAGNYHSVSLNGTTAYLDAPHSSSLNITGAVTIEAWVKLNTTAGSTRTILQKAEWYGTEGGYELSVNGEGKVRLDTYNTPTQYNGLVGTTPLSANVWHHVAGVNDGTQQRVYVDGLLDGTAAATVPLSSTTHDLLIGRISYPYDIRWFQGLLDEVRVSTGAIYTSNFTPSAHLSASGSTRGLWKFDGQTTDDSSSNGNNATLHDGVTYSSDVPADVTGSQRPVPVTGGPYTGTLSQPVSFNGSGSFDPDGTITSYHWNFGDGTVANSQNPAHTYAGPGVYTATLTVTDNGNLLASATTSVTVAGSSNSRLDPLNQTGGGGENPLSRNFNWNLPLVNLPGRAGLDLNIGLSYNSLVWTKYGSNFISFDDDNGWPAPGFRLGFPVIQPLYYNQEVGKYAYLLIGPDGSRTELRQVSTTAPNNKFYESADSSHLLLDNSTMILRTTDGTQLSFANQGNDFRCTQIKDRNGNYITINYVSGRVDTVIDTLNRSITFNYNGSGSLTSITQTWTINGQPQTHTWASFGYTTKSIQTNFTGLVPGAPATFDALTQVTLDDGSRFNFDYTSWGQVWKISNFAADNHLLNYRSYNLPLNNSTSQTDCPRFTERRDWAENWNRSGTAASGYMLPTGAEQEVVTTYIPAQTGTASVPGQSPQAATVVQITNPDNTFTKIYYLGTSGTDSGWKVGLPYLVETYDVGGSIPQGQAVTNWTQDDDTSLFIINPRVAETNIYDPSGNRKRTEIVYQPHVLGNGMTCQLPEDIREYDANASSVLRTTRIIYEDNAAYLNRRIIGLPKVRSVYEGLAPSGALQSKLEVFYDGSAIEGSGDPAAIQHDETNYGVSFLLGRGNLTSVQRYDMDAPTQFTTTTTNKYNRAGSLVASKDADNHEVTVSYGDSFASNGLPTDVNPQDATRPFTTLAYPTTVNDAGGYSTRFRYHYDFGAKTWQQTPQPNVTTNTPGPIQTFTYDPIGRLERTTRLTNNSFTRYVYGPNYLESFSSINTVTESANEGHTLQVFDGHGRVIAAASDYPNSTPSRPTPIGDFSAQLVLYDRMGRVQKQSNPTETSISFSAPINPSQFAPLGDDAIGNGGIGWKYVEQTYDWKSRPLSTTNQDGTTRSAAYVGCVCAGGEVVTLTDEGTIDSSGSAKHRQQRIYSDVVGRLVKTELLNWEGGSIYSTTVNTYNSRDQLTSVRQYLGSESSGTFQETSIAYDGYGRIQNKHVPEHSTGPGVTWSYNADDTIQSITDARGAVATFSYNNRHLVENVSYSAPAPIPTVSPMVLAYDGSGNRTSMTDDQGMTNYHYDQLSRMDWEERTFTGVVGTHRLTYSYNLAGQLQSVTDPAGFVVSYNHDALGRVTKVANALSGETVTYAKDLKYRAWGALKEFTHGGNNFKTTLTYNERLQPQQFQVVKSAQQGSTVVMRSDYGYYNDGQLKFADDGVDNKFDRSYRYDHVGRLAQAFTGVGAVANFSDLFDGPYFQAYQHDVWGNLTERNGRYWSEGDSFSASYVNNRRQGPTWLYDGQGNVLQDADATYTYDAVGQNRAMTSANGQRTTTQWHDGNGQAVRVERRKTVPTLTVTNSYYLRSSVMGGKVITELNSAGQKVIGRVYLGELVLGRQDGINAGIEARHENPITGSYGVSYDQGTYHNKAQEDPMGVNVGLIDPFENQVEYEPDLMLAKVVVNRGGQCACPRCFADGIEIDCRIAGMMVEGGAAARCPDDDCGPRTIYNPETGRNEFQPLKWVGGRLGWWDYESQQINPDYKGVNEDGIDIEGVVLDWVKVFRTSQFTGFSFRGVFGLGINPQNPVAQPTLGPCNLTTPSFDELVDHPALGLLSGPFDDDPEAFYNSLSTYNQAVLLNTAAALADAGVNLSNANFIGFYRGDKPGAAAFGIEVTGVTTRDLDRAGLGRSLVPGIGRRSPGKINEGSLEATVHGSIVAFDIDLYNVKSSPMRHKREVDYNKSHKTTTHPGDVARQLAGRGVSSGVRCE